MVAEQLDGSPLGTLLPDPRPVPGDMTICLKCTGAFAFTDDLDLRPLTQEEQAMVDEDPKIAEVRNIIRTEFGFAS